MKPQLRGATVGLLLALLLLPTLPAQAQFTVYDPANHTTQLARMAQDAARWIETINHYLEQIRKYQTMIDKQVEQITSLGNILHTVDEQLARHKNLVHTVAQFGQTIRAVWQLQQDIRNMVTCRILAVQRVWGRMKNGIFDPAQDLRDLEDYLRNSIGRSAQNQIAYQELLLEQDTEFSEAVYQREIAYGRLARAEEAQTKLEEALTRETGKPPDEQQGVGSLLQQLSDVKLYIAQLTAQIADLTKIINDKMVQFGVRFDAHARFGAAVKRETEAWAEMTRLNEQTLQSLGALFDPDNPTEEVFEFTDEDYEPFTLH
jgi:tetratricopeptide (TPR) repeat protein